VAVLYSFSEFHTVLTCEASGKIRPHNAFRAEGDIPFPQIILQGQGSQQLVKGGSHTVGSQHER